MSEPKPERRISDAERACDELRRLRGLIVEADSDPLLQTFEGRPAEPLYDALLAGKKARHALHAEAEAIRAEQ